MIAYIKGILAQKTATEAIIETAGGLAYSVNISLFTYSRLPEEGAQVKILTHFVVKEDAHTLYGFAEESERQMFGHLLGVSGVGPNTARLLLSSVAPIDIKAAIIAENEMILHAVKGIGPKSAKRIILELKDKMLKDGSIEPAGTLDLAVSPGGNKAREEALSALLTLGFQRIPAQRVLNALIKESQGPLSVEQLVKMALQKLS